MKMTGARVVIEVLLEQEVDTVFGYPGGSVLNIYDALYTHGKEIKHILTAHEQGASHAADGYARISGKTGVVIATSGPGATNLVTGIANAYMDSIPMVAITANVATDMLGRDTFQEVDITGVTMPITKHNYIVKDVNELADVLRDAFRIAGSGRPGPVLVDITKDVTANEVAFTPKPKVETSKGENAPDYWIEKAAEVIAKAEKPLIYAGGGIILSDASESLRTFARKLDIPLVSSMMALGAFPADDPLDLGMIGMHGFFEANKAAHQCDTLIVMGARFSDRVTGNRRSFAPNATIVHIDIDPAEIDKNITSHHFVTGNIKDILNQLIALLPEQKHTTWREQIENWKRPLKHINYKNAANPQDILEGMNTLLPDDSIIVTDVGQHQMWTAQYYKFKEPRTFVTSGGLGTMGFGLGAAIGSYYAAPDKKTVLVTGDGCFHMNLNELATLQNYDIPIVIVLMNNQVLGMVRQWQTIFYGKRYSNTHLNKGTDFMTLAKAFGIKGMQIHSNEDIQPVLKEALNYGKAVLVECSISPDACVLPMIPAGGTIEDAIDEVDLEG